MSSSHSVVSDSETTWTIARQAPLSMGFSRQEYCSGLPVTSPGDLPDSGIKPGSPTLQADSLLSEPPEKIVNLNVSGFVGQMGSVATAQLSVQFSSVAQLCSTLCDPMNRSTPGLPVHHHLSEFTQTHVHQVRDAIQPSHPLSSPSPPAPNPSQHQGLFQ